MRSAPRTGSGPAPARRAAGSLAALLLAAAAAASPTEVPFLAGRVNDTAGLLAAAARERIEGKLADLEAATGAQVAVLTVDTLAGEPIEAYAMRVAETWKLGQRDRDNGVLVVVAASDRKMRIEVGYGLETVLTDARSRRILDQVMRPRFRAGDFGGGIEAAADAIAGFVRGEEPLPAEASGLVGGSSAPWPARLLGVGVFVLVVGLFSVLAVFSPGCQAWFLYVFLMPFYLAFPAALLGLPVGVAALALWAVAFPVLKLLLGRTKGGRSFVKRHPAWAAIGAAARRGSGGRGWSRSSGGFSGGGGSFGGGGASGSW